MNEVQEAAPEITIKHPDMVLTVLPPNPDVHRHYGLFLEQEAIKRLCIHQSVYPPAVFKMQLAELNQQFATKTFNWRSEAWRQSLEDPKNLQQLVFLILTQERKTGLGPINQVTQEWIADIWDQAYADDGDIWYQQIIAAGREQGKEFAVTYGDKFWAVILQFLNRPNLKTPPQAGNPQNTTSPKSAPSS